MPAPKGGKKGKRTKKGDNEESKTIPLAEQGQLYAIVEKMLGNRRMTVRCSDEQERMAIIPGKFKGRRSWIDPGMLILLNIRDFQDDKADVVYIYDNKESNRLKRQGHLDALYDQDNDEKDDMFTFVTEGEVEPENENVLEKELDIHDL